MTDKSRKILSANYPLLLILIGVMLVSFSMGPFRNGDAEWEFKAATGVIRWGMPYVEVQGSLMNQPPLEFYLQGLFLQVFGASIDTGVILVTFLSMGSTIMVFFLGKELYGKTTGLFAAALFALTPWSLVLSRSFLIDVPCLFFSILCLYMGILATRRGSVKLAFVTGLFFAAAFLTKLFAVFVLIPLLLFYLYYHPRGRKTIVSQLLVFSIPVLASSYLWYQVIMRLDWFYFFSHNDFHELNTYPGDRTYLFAPNFILDYGLGWFFVGAALYSIFLTIYLRKRSVQRTTFDLICLATIAAIVGVNTFLGVILNLEVPYTSVIKYCFQALPFFALLVASLASKCQAMLDSEEIKNKLNFALLIVGAFALTASLLSIIWYGQQTSQTYFLKYTVQLGSLQGYALCNANPVTLYSIQMLIQWLGYAFVLGALLSVSRSQVKRLYNVGYCWLYAKIQVIAHKKR